jgi:hypothetical protein
LEILKKLIDRYCVRVTVGLPEILKLTGKIIFDLLHRDEKGFPKELLITLLSNENFLKACLVVSVEIVLFIGNVEELSFFKLAEEVDLDLFEFWKILNPIHLHFAIPSPLRIHFGEIEMQLFTFMIWKKANLRFKTDLIDFIKNSDNTEILEIQEIKNIEFNNQSLFVYLNKTDIQNYENSDFVKLKYYKHIQPIYVKRFNFRFF